MTSPTRPGRANLPEAARSAPNVRRGLGDLFADRQSARAWLDTPVAVLNGRTPRQIVVNGEVDQVNGILYVLNAGVSI